MEGKSLWPITGCLEAGGSSGRAVCVCVRVHRGNVHLINFPPVLLECSLSSSPNDTIRLVISFHIKF